VFLELEIRVFIENGLGSFQIFIILQISDKPEVVKNIPKTVFKTRLKNKETTLVLVKYLVISFRSP
jgi:hypothetical protein